MHSSSMYTICCSGHLFCHAPPPPPPHMSLVTHAPCHVCPLPHMLPAMHTSLPHMPPCNASPPTHAPYHAYLPLWTELPTHTRENITFQQLLLRTVKHDASTILLCFLFRGFTSITFSVYQVATVTASYPGPAKDHFVGCSST